MTLAFINNNNHGISYKYINIFFHRKYSFTHQLSAKNLSHLLNYKTSSIANNVAKLATQKR